MLKCDLHVVESRVLTQVMSTVPCRSQGVHLRHVLHSLCPVVNDFSVVLHRGSRKSHLRVGKARCCMHMLGSSRVLVQRPRNAS